MTAFKGVNQWTSAFLRPNVAPSIDSTSPAPVYLLGTLDQCQRSGVVRSFRPVGHRHTAEIEQELRLGGGGVRVDLSVTSVELVRGVLATAHVYTTAAIDDKALWKIYRDTYTVEPFVRIVKERTGIWRYPEPKLLAGTNFAEVGFALDPRGDRIVALCAIDNLVKGAAGQAIQNLNLMFGCEPAAGLRS